MSRELAQLTWECLWLKKKSSVSAFLMCVAVKISVTVSSKLIAECNQLKSQVEAGSKSFEATV